MTTATPDMLDDWLAELSVIAPKREDDGMTEALRLVAYRTRLLSYPADVARAALLSHSWPFWPSWAELEAECERLVKGRRLLLAGANRAANEMPRHEEAERVRVTPEAAARILAEAGLTPSRLAAIANGRRMPPPMQPGYEEPEPAPPMTAEEAAARPYTDAERARMARLRPQPQEERQAQ